MQKMLRIRNTHTWILSVLDAQYLYITLLILILKQGEYLD